MNDRLKNIKEQKAFNVPEDYFESLDDRIIERIPIEGKERKENWIDDLIYRLQLRFSIPALSVVMLVATVLYINLEVEFSEPLLMSDEEIAEYLLEEYDEEVELELYALSSNKVERESDLLLTDEEIVNYLSEEATDEELMEYIQNGK